MQLFTLNNFSLCGHKFIISSHCLIEIMLVQNITEQVFYRACLVDKLMFCFVVILIKVTEALTSAIFNCFRPYYKDFLGNKIKYEIWNCTIVGLLRIQFILLRLVNHLLYRDIFQFDSTDLYCVHTFKGAKRNVTHTATNATNNTTCIGHIISQQVVFYFTVAYMRYITYLFTYLVQHKYVSIEQCLKTKLNIQSSNFYLLLYNVLKYKRQV